jgi:UDP-glucose:glycoprotein glucosyltransferase
MDSADPLETLIKLSQNFPKYSSTVAAHNATGEMLQEIRHNRAKMLPGGYNVMWINGVQIDTRQIDAFSLLEHLRRERKLIEKFRGLGLSANDAVKILSHQVLTEAQAGGEEQRYDYRDDSEENQVIIWLNDLEKDSRYEGWSSELDAVCVLPRIILDYANCQVVYCQCLSGTAASSAQGSPQCGRSC